MVNFKGSNWDQLTKLARVMNSLLVRAKLAHVYHLKFPNLQTNPYKQDVY